MELKSHTEQFYKSQFQVMQDNKWQGMHNIWSCWMITLRVDAGWQRGWVFSRQNHIVWISHTKFFNAYLSIYARFKEFGVLLEVEIKDLKIFLKNEFTLPKKGKMEAWFCTWGLLTHANVSYYPCEHSA